MSAIFDSLTLGPTERLVMLALADHADDEGKCYPSILRLCDRTGLSERAVQNNIKKLVSQGYLSVNIGGGKGNANLYFVSPNPAANAPRTRCTPAPDAPQTPQQVRPNPAPDAPEPSVTIIEPSIRGAADALEILAVLAEVVSQDTAEAFISHRKAKRAKLTLKAAQLIAKDIRGHPDADAVVLNSIKNGWTGVFPEKSKGAQNDGPSKSEQRIRAFIEGATGSSGMDCGPRPDPAQPLLAGR